MNTGLFRLLKSAGSREKIIDYLDNSSYDELIEFDLEKNKFSSLYHTSKKYSSMLSEGSIKELYIAMSELTVNPQDKSRFCEILNPVTLGFTIKNSEIEGLFCEEFRFRLLNDSWCYVEAVFVSGSFWNVSENIVRMYIFDIQSRKSREMGLQEAFLYSDGNRNEITGLLRKKAFIGEVEKIIKEEDKNWCLAVIDIDKFKLFNEWYGHSVGDLLMTQIGAKLKETNQFLGGTAGYFGQDDFCLLYPFSREVTDNLYQTIASLISANGNETGFRPAFGLSMIEESCNVMDMIDRAFLAVNVAKQGYKKRIRFFEPSMYKEENSEYHILADFMKALKTNEIVFYVQPQCRTSSGKIVGAEALSRWMLPDGSLISPDSFIPVLEKHGIITDLDFYIWEEVCKWQRKWIDGGNTPLPLSVNVSAHDIKNLNLTDVFVNLTEKYQLSRNLIKIEITESSYSKNAQLIKNTVHELHENGFTVLMDDFGSGYSTLNMLKDLSVDIIKLDAQFLNIGEDNTEKSIKIIESVSSMAKTLGLPIVAEGVENAKQKQFLHDLGCRYIQGYYFYAPMDIQSYEELISDLNNIDTSGMSFKANQQFQLREILDNNVYSDTMLNNIIGPCAFYSRHDKCVDIIRFNEQFYETVDVPDFMDRIENIQRFLPPVDIDRMHMLLDQAKDDRLNGSSGMLHFYKTDGTLTSYVMRFYYLRNEEGKEIFYGAVQNVTRLVNLEKQIHMLVRLSKETVIFLSRKLNGGLSFAVLFNALEKELGMTREQLENELNSKDFFERIGSENETEVYDRLLDNIYNSRSFETVLNIKSVSGEILKLLSYGDYVIDDTGTMDYIITVRKLSNDTVRQNTLHSDSL